MINSTVLFGGRQRLTPAMRNTGIVSAQPEGTGAIAILQQLGMLLCRLESDAQSPSTVFVGQDRPAAVEISAEKLQLPVEDDAKAAGGKAVRLGRKSGREEVRLSAQELSARRIGHSFGSLRACSAGVRSGSKD